MPIKQLIFVKRPMGICWMILSRYISRRKADTEILLTRLNLGKSSHIGSLDSIRASSNVRQPCARGCKRCASPKTKWFASVCTVQLRSAVCSFHVGNKVISKRLRYARVWACVCKRVIFPLLCFLMLDYVTLSLTWARKLLQTSWVLAARG